MYTPKNTDDIVPDQTTLPTPEQEALPTRLIDIHIYNLSQAVEGEQIQSSAHTLVEAGEDIPQTPETNPENQSEQTEQTELIKKQHKHPRSLLFLVLIALFVLIMVGGSLAYVLLFTPTVTVTIIPQSQQIQTTGTIHLVTGNADTANDEVKGRILPAITMSQTQTAATTGTTYQEARPGQGTITFYNAALSAQTIVTGTLLTGADGVQVATDHGVTVPTAKYPTFGTASASAHALTPGPGGNIKASDIYGSCCLLNISAVNSPFTGGQEAQTYQSVSQHDIDTTEAHLKTSLTQAVTAAFSIQTQSTETLITPPACQQTITSDHKLGDKATQVQVTVSESCTGVTYNTASFRHLMRHMQTNAASKEEREHYQLAGEVQVAIQTVTPESTKGSYQLTVHSTGTWVYHFSQASLIDLATAIAGKDTRQATQVLLHTPGVRQVSLAAGTLPSDPQKIHFLLLVQQ